MRNIVSKITQLVKGTDCNANCPMCLSLHNKYAQVPEEAFLDQPYALDDLRNAYQQALQLGSTELVITSYGDPLVNFSSYLPHEIELARELGFDQVTLITNGFALTPGCSNILADSGLTHLVLSIHALEQGIYQRIMGNTSVQLLDVLSEGWYAAKALGLVVRHNYVWNKTLTFEEVLAQSIEYGASQITLIESVPANNHAKWLHTRLPTLPAEAQLIKQYAWGMDIYQLDDVTVALCYFGQDDPDFDQQAKNLYINITTQGEIILREGAYFDLTDGVFAYA